MDLFEASLGRRHQLRVPLDLSFTLDGITVVAGVLPATHEPLQSSHSRVWRFSEAVQLTNGSGGDGLPHLSPRDDTLTFVSELELVVYPREGHGVRVREHQLDAWRCTIGRFDHFLGSPR